MKVRNQQTSLGAPSCTNGPHIIPMSEFPHRKKWEKGSSSNEKAMERVGIAQLLRRRGGGFRFSGVSSDTVAK